MNCFFTYPNADYGSEIIIKKINQFRKKNTKIVFRKNLPINIYFSLLNELIHEQYYLFYILLIHILSNQDLYHK